MFALSGEWDRAIELTRRSIQHDPVRSYIAYGNMAGYYRMLSLLDRSSEAANQALALRLDDAVSLVNLAWAALVSGRTDEAVARAERLAASSPDARR